MNFPNLVLIKKTIILSIFLLLTVLAFSQQSDTAKGILHFNGAISITNNGFSLIPAFSLGKPAVIATIYAGGQRLSFEPEFRYSLEGKPWSFIFIWRYKLIKKDKFQFSLGTHFPALNFISDSVTRNGVEQEAIRARRFFPVIELIPTWIVGKGFNIGMLYQYGRALEKELAKNTHFALLRTNFTNISLSKNIFVRFTPQLYYLKMDVNDGFYFASALTVSKRNFPVSVSSLVNKAIQTDIAGRNFDWNVSLVYSFNTMYSRL